MSEFETQSVEEEVAQPQDQGIDQGQTDQEPASNQEQSKKSADYNWKEMRKAMAEKDRQMDELKRRLDSLVTPSQEEEDISDEDIPSYKHVRRSTEKTEKRLTGRIAELEQQLIEQKINAQFPDYKAVVNQDSIDQLKQIEPELAYALSKNDNPYSQAVAAYKAIKALGISSPQESVEKRRALENSKKPLSAQAVPKPSSPISAAGMSQSGFLTNELKAQMWKEMRDAIKHG